MATGCGEFAERDLPAPAQRPGQGRRRRQPAGSGRRRFPVRHLDRGEGVQQRGCVRRQQDRQVEAEGAEPHAEHPQRPAARRG